MADNAIQVDFLLKLSVITKVQEIICAFLLSCPVRGTWIEMALLRFFASLMGVVPRTGHVD